MLIKFGRSAVQLSCPDAPGADLMGPGGSALVRRSSSAAQASSGRPDMVLVTVPLAPAQPAIA